MPRIHLTVWLPVLGPGEVKEAFSDIIPLALCYSPKIDRAYEEAVRLEVTERLGKVLASAVEVRCLRSDEKLTPWVEIDNADSVPVKLPDFDGLLGIHGMDELVLDLWGEARSLHTLNRALKGLDMAPVDADPPTDA